MHTSCPFLGVHVPNWFSVKTGLHTRCSFKIGRTLMQWVNIWIMNFKWYLIQMNLKSIIIIIKIYWIWYGEGLKFNWILFIQTNNQINFSKFINPNPILRIRPNLLRRIMQMGSYSWIWTSWLCHPLNKAILMIK